MDLKLSKLSPASLIFFVSVRVTVANSFTFDTIITFGWVRVFQIQVKKVHALPHTTMEITKWDEMRWWRADLVPLGIIQFWSVVWLMLPHLFFFLKLVHQHLPIFMPDKWKCQTTGLRTNGVLINFKYSTSGNQRSFHFWINGVLLYLALLHSLLLYCFHGFHFT